MINRYDPSMQYIGTGEYIPCAELEECGDFVKYEDHLAELSSLRLKLEECQKDAERYRLLRDIPHDESILKMLDSVNSYPNTPEEFDETIDKVILLRKPSV